MLIVFNLFQTVGFYGFANWVPTFLIKQGIAVTASLGYTFVIAIAAPFGPLLAALVSRPDRAQMDDRRRGAPASRCSDLLSQRCARRCR